MKKFSFNEGTLGFDKNKVTYEVPLEKTKIHSLDEIKFIKEIPHMFPISNMEITQNKTFFQMEIKVEGGFFPLSFFKSNSTIDEKHEFIIQICNIVKELRNYSKLVTVLDDKNILVNSSTLEVKLLYRGIQGLMPASSYTEEDINIQVKRLALFILTSAKYDELRINGLNMALNKVPQERYKMVSRIHQSSTIDDILTILNQEKESTIDEKNVEETKKKSIFSKIPPIKIEEKFKSFGKRTAQPNPKPKQKPKNEQKPQISDEMVENPVAASLEKQVTITKPEKKKIVFPGGSKIKIITGVLIGAILIIFILDPFEDKNETSQTTFASNQADEELLMNGLQSAAIQSYEEATNNFDKLETPFNDLEKESQKAILFSYLMSGKYQTAIELEPNFANSIINYLVSKDTLEAVRDIESEEPVILFEKAALNEDAETVLKYKDEIKLDGRRESLVVDAYIKLNQLDEAVEFAKSKGNQDLESKVENIKKQQIEAKEQEEKKKAEQKKKEEKKKNEKEEEKETERA